MPFYTYIIYSQRIDKYYIGHTENLQNRLAQHNDGISKFTAKANDWQLVYFESFVNRQQAKNREMSIKKMKSRKYIESLINTNR